MPAGTIYQFAYIREKQTCPVCGKNLSQYREYTIPVFSSDKKNSKRHICNMLYCSNCALPFIDSEIGEAILDATGCWPGFFVPNKNCSAESIRQKMYHKKKQREHTLQAKQPCTPRIELIQRSTVAWKTSKRICTLPIDDQTCPKCGSALVHDYTLLPVSEQENAKIHGRSCRKCGIIYIQETIKSKLNELMRDNPLGKGFTLDGRELWNASAVEKEQARKEAQKQRWLERKQKIQAVPFAVVMICTRSQGEIQEYIITNGKSDSKASGIFHYKSLEGRELLSAAFAEQRKGKGTLCGNSFKVVDKVFAREHIKSLPEYILPVQLTIGADGGYYSSVVNRNYELVDSLVYSPSSQRYELLPSTYNKGCDYCYTDISRFRKFVQEHGNPGIELDFLRHFSNRLSDRNLQSESVLMAYGYSVSEASQLSALERREILAEIVDLKILKVHQVVVLLNFFCRTHSGAMYGSARAKWTSDKEFIENYKVNPERFLITHIAANTRKNDGKRQTNDTR